MPKYKRQSTGNIQVPVTTKKLFQIESSRLRPNGVRSVVSRASFGSTYTKIGTIQRRLAWPLRKDDTQNREAFHIFPLIIKIRPQKSSELDRFEMLLMLFKYTSPHVSGSLPKRLIDNVFWLITLFLPTSLLYT